MSIYESEWQDQSQKAADLKRRQEDVEWFQRQTGHDLRELRLLTQEESMDNLSGYDDYWLDKMEKDSILDELHLISEWDEEDRYDNDEWSADYDAWGTVSDFVGRNPEAEAKTAVPIDDWFFPLYLLHRKVEECNESFDDSVREAFRSLMQRKHGSYKIAR